MSLLAWVAVLVGAWCVASVVAATGFGVYLRRARGGDAGTRRPTGADTLDPLDTGPMRMWLAELPETPEPTRPRGASEPIRP